MPWTMSPRPWEEIDKVRSWIDTQQYLFSTYHTVDMN